MNKNILTLLSICVFALVLSTPVHASTNYTFLNQTPSDINTTFLSEVLIEYNINDSNGINESSVNLTYKTNSSTRENILFVNGTNVSGYQSANVHIDNVSNLWNFSIDDNHFLPGTFNIDDELMEDNVHTSSSLNTDSKYTMMQFLNVSNLTTFNAFEIMANVSSGAGSGRVYYCNSSYVNTDPTSSSNCAPINTLVASSSYDHTHNNNSKHQVVAMAINITSGTVGMVNTVRVTPTSYFLFRGISGTQWELWSIGNTSRASAIQTSLNSGTTWTNQTYTVDAHLHQYTGDETFYYYPCVNNSLGVTSCAAQRSDTLNIDPQPPSPPTVTVPINTTYGNVTMTITHTGASSPQGSNMSFYNITLVYPNETFVKIIQSNNGLNVTYNWSTNTTTSGQYRVKIEVTDNNSFTAYGLSDVFTLNTLTIIVVANGTIGDTCLNSSYSNHVYTITGFSDNGTFVSQVFQESELCNNGCSDTINDCRYGRLTEIVLLLIIIVGLLLFIWITKNMNYMFSYATMIIAALAAILIFITDVFSDDINTLFLITAFAILTYGVMISYQSYKEKNKQEEY